MKLRDSRYNRSKAGLFKRFGIVIGIVVLFFGAVKLISYVTQPQSQPQINYSLKKADCSSTAIMSRNKILGADLKSCVLVISAANLQDKSIYVDYDGVGGGPLGDGKPLIRINSKDNKFCYVALAGKGASFTPRSTNNLTLRCALVPNPPKNYDENSDANPISIQISDYSKTTINVDPAR
jgi:hypothetical protein